MKVVNPSVAYVERENVSPYNFMEDVAKTCYLAERSEDPSTKKDFVTKLLMERHHLSIAEHWWLHYVLKEPRDTSSPHYDKLLQECRKIEANKRGRDGIDYLYRLWRTTRLRGTTYLSVPVRSMVEMGEWMSLLDKKDAGEYPMLSAMLYQFGVLYKPITPGYSERVGYRKRDDVSLFPLNPTFRDALPGYLFMRHSFHTLRFVCDRGVTHELVRHRMASFAQESTRYCNYSKDRFGSEVTFIRPCFWDEGSTKYMAWEQGCRTAEKWYLGLLADGASPQEARSILPHSVKAEIVVTANEIEWEHILDLRYEGTTGTMHPQMREVMGMAKVILLEKSEGRIGKWRR